MIVIIATMKVKEGSGPEFESVMSELADAVRKDEPGNIQYTINLTSDGDYVILEKYKDQAAVQAHQKATHFKTSFPKLSQHLDGPPKIQFLKEVY
ncbi:MAG: antibiotic biosynthesis monooxygenase [Gammaproteobacteria bacterium]|nr:MAG: antibiotic biosynthesis monooxygenase [Gammaproteobacteria bacterium]